MATSQPMPPRERLAARVRELRTSAGFGVTQRQLAEALGASTALISSWESGGAVPPEHRLEAYGRFFSTRRSVTGPAPILVPPDELKPEERQQAEALVEELVALREEALSPGSIKRPEGGALGGRFWHFPDGQPITVLCTPLSQRQLGHRPDGTLGPGAPPISAYAQPSHPNHIVSLRNGDIDSLLELVGYIRAENPTREVRWKTFDQSPDQDELTSHLVVLGGAQFSPSPAANPTERLDPVVEFIRLLELPVKTRLPEGGDDEFDTEFVVTTDEEGAPAFNGPREEMHRPGFLRGESEPDRPRVIVDGSPQLGYDVALIVRKANPLNQSARITICSGVFTRGTYGAVRAFTDPNLRIRNERYVYTHVRDPNDFWILFQVPVYGGFRTVTPDLERPSYRLRQSA